jgi:hypothetical protein
VVWLFIHIGFLTGFRNRIGALFSWWFAFTRDLRRERSFTIDDMPVAAYSGQAGYAASPKTPAGWHSQGATWRYGLSVDNENSALPGISSRALPFFGRRRGTHRSL